MGLQFVEPPKGGATVNTLLYGPAKSGKSTGAASAPGPILYLNADVGNALRFAHQRHGDRIKEARVEGLQTLIDAIDAAKSGEYATVVLDPIGDVYRRVLEGLSNRALSPKIQHYGDTGTHLERFCRQLCEEPVNVVLVAHEIAEKDEASGEVERLPFTGTNNPKLAHKLLGMVDIIGYAGISEPKDGGDPEYGAQLINGNGRRGGDRFGVLGSYRQVDISEWVGLANGSDAAPQETAELNDNQPEKTAEKEK